MHSVTPSHAFEQLSSFHSSCYSFFSLSLSLLISPSLADVSSLRLSHVSLHYQASLACQPRESIAAQTRRRSKEHIKEEGRQMRSDWFFLFFFNSRPTSVFLRLAWQTEGFILLIYVPHSLIRSHSCLNMNNAERRRWEKAADDNLLLMSAGFYLHMSFTPRFSLGL